MTRLRGNYYATGTYRENGKRYGWQVARQAKTLRQACEALDNFRREGATGQGYVQLWLESEQRRVIVAERDEAGNWWGNDPHTGNLVPITPCAGGAK